MDTYALIKGEKLPKHWVFIVYRKKTPTSAKQVGDELRY